MESSSGDDEMRRIRPCDDPAAFRRACCVHMLFPCVLVAAVAVLVMFVWMRTFSPELFRQSTGTCDACFQTVVRVAQWSELASCLYEVMMSALVVAQAHCVAGTCFLVSSKIFTDGVGGSRWEAHVILQTAPGAMVGRGDLRVCIPKDCTTFSEADDVESYVLASGCHCCTATRL